MNRPRTIVGLDLGQSIDWTALSVVQAIGADLHVRHLERWRHEPYPVIVRRVARLLAEPDLHDATLVIDATGVGRPVLDMFHEARLDPVAVTITGGDSVQRDGREYRAPKRDLIASLQLAFQNQRLKVAASLPLASVLVQELANFRVSISLSGHDSYGAGPAAQWREGAHDDLVLSVALATWYAEHPIPSNRLITF